MLYLLFLMSSADPSGLYQTPDRQVAIVVTRQEGGWRTEWWYEEPRVSYIGDVSAIAPYEFIEWWRSTDPSENNQSGAVSWGICPYTRTLTIQRASSPLVLYRLP